MRFLQIVRIRASERLVKSCPALAPYFGFVGAFGAVISGGPDRGRFLGAVLAEQGLNSSRAG